jgi:hypothetical protein
LALSALSLSHLAIKTLLARSLFSMWSLLGPIFPYREDSKTWNKEVKTGRKKKFPSHHFLLDVKLQ